MGKDDNASSTAGQREGFLEQLRRVNTERYHAWVGDGEDAGILFDAAELGGEVGELLNVVKKLVREEKGWRGSRADPADFADECADVLICLDKLARRRGVDLCAATVAKFNATSQKVGLPHRLASPSAPEERRDEVERLREALTEVIRLRLATDEGSLRVRADRTWEIATKALRASPPSRDLAVAYTASDVERWHRQGFDDEGIPCD